MQSNPPTTANAAQFPNDCNHKSTTHTETSSSVIDDEKRDFDATPRPDISNGIAKTEVLNEKSESKSVSDGGQQEAKDSHAINAGSIAPNEHVIRNEGEGVDGVEEEDNDGIELVYPGGLQLALLTLGLCLATFTVALGKSIPSRFQPVGLWQLRHELTGTVLRQYYHCHSNPQNYLCL